MLFAPHAPEQNPVKDLWLKGKNWLRKPFAENKTFAPVKPSFSEFLTNNFFDSHQIDLYANSFNWDGVFQFESL
jgi:transposase